LTYFTTTGYDKNKTEEAARQEVNATT